MTSAYLIVEGFRDALVELLNTVPDIGVVHPKVKFSSDWQKFLDNFGYYKDGKKQIRGWWISVPVTGTGSSRFEEFDGSVMSLDYPLRGVMSFSDTADTEYEFTRLLYRVHELISAQTNAGVAATPGGDFIVPGTIASVIRIAELRQFGSILCHYCEISVRVVLDAHLP